MGKIVTHRGPDNFSVITDNNVGFAHNRLSILDLSPNANQPFVSDSHILAYNGEIYTYREIRRELQEEHGVTFKSTSDTEVLFHSLVHFGVDESLQKIKGMFAFAFYDRRTGVLILARDRFGIKPLYYIKDQTGFYWASEIKVLSKTLNLTPEPIKTLFALGGQGERSKRNTLFRGVFSLEPGSYLRICCGKKVTVTRYYDPVEQFNIHRHDDLNARSTGSVLEEFEELFVASVENMLASDAPMGLFMGGVDSSLIAAVAKKKNPDIQLFTANVVGQFSEFDDTKVSADHIGAELRDYKFEPDMFLRDWAEATYYYESPIVVHTNSIPMGNVARLAREFGVKAVLTGEGADELFLGYPRLLAERYKHLALLPDKIVKSLYKLVPGLSEYLFPAPSNKIASFLGSLSEGFESQLVDQQSDVLSISKGRRRSEQKMTIKMLNEHLITLLHRNDRMGMMASIEARFPFLDEDLVAFAINLPAKYKIRSSLRFHNHKHPFLVDKWILRKTAEKYLPKSIVYKKKFGFGMFGHKFIEVDAEFFRDGWLSDTLGWDNKTIEHLVETQDRYFVAKLASLEIFGRIFALHQDIEDVTTLILRNIRLENVPV
jgi:asparagine synthase (glutamine-hydrolysing)